MMNVATNGTIGGIGAAATKPTMVGAVESNQSSSRELTVIPVRMLNEFAYCPRLAYLEWVQGEWAENIETLEGAFGHRNVDRPGRQAIPLPNGVEATPQYVTPTESTLSANCLQSEQMATIHARSIDLSAPVEGLTAKLDLLELDGSVATPIDYKRGTVPDIPEGAYEPERVQLCAQGLILRENGYQCFGGVIYYIASRRRVAIPFTDGLIERTRELAAQFRQTAARGLLPPPLEDSPKCPRCSLVGICLPDEINLLRQSSVLHQLDASLTSSPSTDVLRSESPAVTTPVESTVRRLIPAGNHAFPLYLQDQGISLSKSGERLIVKKKGEEVHSTAIKDVSQVCLFGSVYVTEPVLRELATRGIPVCHFSYGGWFYAVTSGLTHKNVELRIRQFGIAARPGASLELARQFVIGKIKNSRTLLRRHLPNHGKDKLLWQLNEYVEKARRAESVDSLLGIEGTAARVYFGGFRQLLKGDGSFDIDGRNRRPPRDSTNALLSFLYSLLTKDLQITLQAVGFDPLLGVYHQPRFGKPALALDLAEEFRPLIADSTVLSLVNNREVQAQDFVTRAGAVALTDAGRRAVMAAYERRMQTEIVHPIFGYKLSYRRTLEVQARLLARTMLGELSEYPSFLTR